MLASLASAQTDLITYQGRLEQDGAAVTGAVSMRISIRDAVTGGNELFFSFITVTVTNGEFTALLGPFGAGVFNGGNRWIEIAVDDPAVAGLNYVPLTPRQPFTAAPYALRATVATSVSGSVPAAQITGNLPTSQLSGTISPTILSSGTTAGTITFSPAAGAPFLVSSTTKVLNLNSDLLDGLDSTAFLQKSGGTMTGNLSIANPAVVDFGSTTRQMLNLWGTTYGIGVQGAALYQRSNADFSWFKGGVHSDTQNSPGAGGVENMRLDSVGTLSLFGTEAGFSVENRSDATKRWVTYADGAGALDTFRLWSGVTGDRLTVTEGGNMNVVGSVTAPYIVASTNDTSQHALQGYHTSASGSAAGVFGQSSSTGGFGVYGVGISGGYGSKFVCNGAAGWAVYGVSDVGYAGYFQGKVNISSSLSVSGSTTFQNEVTAQGSLGGFAVKNRNDQAKRWVMYARNGGGVDQLSFYSDTTGDVASLSPTGDMYLVGALSTTVLTIRGGADVAEPFEMTEPEELEPGSVVIIDEDHPGKLKQSTQACDTRVAGIISGAGGVKPGLRLHQDGVLDGDHHVALSGRVYVKADTSGGRIKPGDLLTTSITPGHAAKVTNHERAQGAILGKAMSGLDEGTGLVLVLVTLQ